jgi:hypothetical protein
MLGHKYRMTCVNHLMQTRLLTTKIYQRHSKRQRMMDTTTPISPRGLSSPLLTNTNGLSDASNTNDIAIDVARTPPNIETSTATTVVSSSSASTSNLHDNMSHTTGGHYRPSLHPLQSHSSSTTSRSSASDGDDSDRRIISSMTRAEEDEANETGRRPTTGMGLMDTLVERLAERHNRRRSFQPNHDILPHITAPTTADDYSMAQPITIVNVTSATPRSHPIPSPAHVVTAHSVPATIVATSNNPTFVTPSGRVLPIERPLIPSTAATVVIDELVSEAALYASDSPRSVRVRGGLTRDEYDLINASFEDAPRRERDYQVIVSLKVTPALPYLPRGNYIPLHPPNNFSSAYSSVCIDCKNIALHTIVISYMAAPPLPAYLQARLVAKEQIAKQLQELEAQHHRTRSSLSVEQQDAEAEMSAKLARRRESQQIAAAARARYALPINENKDIAVQQPGVNYINNRPLTVTTQHGRTHSPARSPTANTLTINAARSRSPSPARVPAGAVMLSAASVGPSISTDHHFHHHHHGHHHHHHSMNSSSPHLSHHLPSLSPPESPSRPRSALPSQQGTTLPSLSPSRTNMATTSSEFTFAQSPLAAHDNNHNNIIGSHAHPLPSLSPPMQPRSSSGSSSSNISTAATVSSSMQSSLINVNVTPRPVMAPTPMTIEHKRRVSPSTSTLPTPQPQQSLSSSSLRQQPPTASAVSTSSSSRAPSSSRIISKPLKVPSKVPVARISPATGLSSLDRVCPVPS